MVNFKSLVIEYIEDYELALKSDNQVKRIFGILLFFIFVIWCFPVWGSQLAVNYLKERRK